MTLKNRRVFELRLGKSGLVVFIVGMSFLLFCGFLLGVVVGKHMDAYPEQYAFGLMGLVRDSLIAASPTEVKKEAGDVEEETFNLTFYDTLGVKKEGAAAGRTPPPAPSGEGSPKRQAAPAESPAGATVAQSPSPSQGDAVPQVKEASPSGGGRFEIQVAAYRDERQAQRMVKRFAALGYSPHVVSRDLAEKGLWFRVILAGFESREEANEASERIVAKFRGIKCVIRPAGNS